MNNPLIHIQTIIQKNETTIDLRKKYGPSKLLKILSLKLLLPLLINRTSLSRTLLKAADNRIYLKVFDLHNYAGCSGQKWTYMWIFLFDGPCFSWQKTRVVVENFKVGGNKQRVKWIRDRGKRNGKVFCCYFSFSHSLRSFLERILRILRGYWTTPTPQQTKNSGLTQREQIMNSNWKFTFLPAEMFCQRNQVRKHLLLLM